MNYKKFYKNTEGYSNDKKSMANLAMNAKYDGQGNSISDKYIPKTYVMHKTITDACEYHNGIYRGKDVTDRFESGDIARDLKAGIIRDLYIGDYFWLTIPDVPGYIDGISSTNYKCIIAIFKNREINMKLGVIPYINYEFSNRYQWNKTDTTSGGYLNSAMFDYLNDDAGQRIHEGLMKVRSNKFILSRTDVFTHYNFSSLISTSVVSGNGSHVAGIVNGYSNKSDKYEIMLLSETEVYGSRIWSSGYFDNINNGHNQLPLFKLNRAHLSLIMRDAALRSIADATSVCCVGTNGMPSKLRAAGMFRIMPIVYLTPLV